MRLQDKVTVITGAGGGIGSGIAEVFSMEGARVIIADVDVRAGETVAEQIRSAGGTATFLELDVTQEQSWVELISKVRENFGRLDVLVNNAGINRRYQLEEFPVDAWDQVMAVNVRGVFLGIKHVIPIMRDKGGGSIINMSSICGLIGHKYTPIGYTASKGAVTLLTKAVATQYAGMNIRCNSIHPSTADTPLVAELFKDPVKKKQRLDEVPLGRLASIKDIALAAVYLASDESSFLTGVSLPVDGGLTAG